MTTKLKTRIARLQPPHVISVRGQAYVLRDEVLNLIDQVEAEDEEERTPRGTVKVETQDVKKAEK